MTPQTRDDLRIIDKMYVRIVSKMATTHIFRESFLDDYINDRFNELERLASLDSYIANMKRLINEMELERDIISKLIDSLS